MRLVWGYRPQAHRDSIEKSTPLLKAVFTHFLMNTTQILFLGDIVGRPGREAVKKTLPDLIKKHQPDFVIANAENITHGAGISREKLEEMMEVEIDGFTAGDHTFDQKKVSEALDDPTVPLVRPANWPGPIPGRGWRIIEKNGKRLLLMNVMGRVFMKVGTDDYFTCIEQILKEAERQYDVSFLDFHAEATSEKRATAEFFDGKIDVVVGTHTHVQTNDAQTLPEGTGFMTDAGMCGPQDSILGAEKEGIIKRLRTQIMNKREVPEGPCIVCGCCAEIGESGTEMTLINLIDINY